MDAIADSMKAAAKAAEAVARFCKTMMRIENPFECKETREEQFVDDWFVTRKMDKEPTFADAIEWADKTMIDKACEWIIEHIDIPYEGEFIDDSPVASDYIEYCEKRLEYAKAVADAFKQAMEE